MTDPETAAETQLRDIADALEALRFRLLGVQASLPPSSLERDPLQEEDEMDTATEIRAVVGCVLEDRIEPALQELRRTIERKED
ncbi:MAG TPA: hypothetical protein VIE43_20460 [Thermoanaerobaculia bacterium]|jgi:hypothetical protein|nr:hypothetical protein [Thermoanaerobaculia bacterium]